MIEDLIPRLFNMIEGTAHDGNDAILEEINSRFIEGRPKPDAWYYAQYTPLLDAIDSETSANKGSSMAKYIKNLYK